MTRIQFGRKLKYTVQEYEKVAQHNCKQKHVHQDEIEERRAHCLPLPRPSLGQGSQKTKERRAGEEVGVDVDGRRSDNGTTTKAGREVDGVTIERIA